MGEKLTRYWVSWVQPGPDPRPIYEKDGPVPLGGLYWITGEAEDGSSTICAVVDAISDVDARSKVTAHWPDHGEWRFIVEKEPDYMPSSDRFPLPLSGGALAAIHVPRAARLEALLAAVSQVNWEEATTYEGNLEANLHLSVDALTAIRSALAALR